MAYLESSNNLTLTSYDNNNLIQTVYGDSTNYAIRYPMVRGDHFGILVSSGSLVPLQALGATSIDLATSQTLLTAYIATRLTVSGTGNTLTNAIRNATATGTGGCTSGYIWNGSVCIHVPSGYQIITSSTTFTVPANITSVRVLTIGNGGSGGGGYYCGGGGGGNSGNAATGTYVVTPNQQISITVNGTSSFGSYQSSSAGTDGGYCANGGNGTTVNTSILSIFTQGIVSIGAGAPISSGCSANAGGGGGGIVVSGMSMYAGGGGSGGCNYGAGGGTGYGAGGGGAGANNGSGG